MTPGKETAEEIVAIIGEGARMRPMFGAYTLYYNDKVVGIIAEEVLFIRITDGTRGLLDTLCEKKPAYEGAKLSYQVLPALFNDMSLIRRVAGVCASDQM